MYALFLQGVSSIVPGVECTDVTEVIDEWSEAEIAAKGLLAGGAEGTTTVRFTLNAHIYERQLAFYGDWFDTAAIDWINEVLTAEGYNSTTKQAERQKTTYNKFSQLTYVNYTNVR